MAIIQPIVLCGGSGTRLWPLSTSNIPKQLISVGGGTFLSETINRMTRVNDVLQTLSYVCEQPLLIMHKNHMLPPELSSYSNSIIYEEYANDTAVAIARAALHLKFKYLEDQNVIMLVVPADHFIENVDNFVQDMVTGISLVNNNNIVLFGLEATSPETKYGYIIPALSDDHDIEFIEKPTVDVATSLLEKKAMWNAGIFAFELNNILECIAKSRFNILDWIENPREGKAPSFDVAILQECSKISAYSCKNWKWSDVGTWESFTEIPEIKYEIINSPSVIRTNCQNVTTLHRNNICCSGQHPYSCENRNNKLVIIGCDDLFVVTHSGNILIMSKKGDHNNTLKSIASEL